MIILRRNDDGSGSAAQADPTLTHVAQELVHEHPLISCRFDPTGRFVVAGSQDYSILRWDLDSEFEDPGKIALTAHESWVHALAFTPDGAILLTGGCDDTLIWWPAAADEPEPIRVVHAHDGWINHASVSPDGALAATGGNDRLVKLWSIEDGGLVRELPGHELPIYRTLFHPSGEFLLTGDLRGVVKQWNVETGEEVRQFDAGKLHSYNAAGQRVNYGGVRGLSLSHDGAYLACGGLIDASNPLGAVNTPAVVVFDWETGEELRLQRPQADIQGAVWGTRFHPNGFLIAVSGGGSGGFLWFFRPDEPHEFAQFNLPNTALDLDLHPDGLRIATAHYDGRLRISAMTPSSPSS